MRLPYLRFASIVARAHREVLREFDDPTVAQVPVIPYSVEASVVETETETVYAPSWGDFYLPDGPIVIWQYPFEAMPDQENYYRQIKDVLRHELRHAQGETHAMPGRMAVVRRA